MIEGTGGKGDTPEAIAYIREKVNQLLGVMGTLPLRVEELDDETLFALDPIGIIADSFTQVLEHLRETNRELALANDEIGAIFESAAAAILVVDDGMGVLALNGKSREWFFPGLEDGRILGKCFREVICEPGLPPEQCVFERVLARGAPATDSDFRFGERHYQVVGAPVRDAGGQLSKVVLVYTDISERMAMQKALQESEFRFRDLLENANDLVQSVAPDGRFLFVNRAWRQSLGYTEEEIGQLNIRDILHPDCQNQCLGKLQSLFEGEEIGRLEVSFLTRDGRKILVEGSCNTRFEEGRPVATRGIFRDVTDRKAAEEALRQSEERFRLLYEKAPLGYQSLDGEACFLEVNQALLDLLGYDRKEILGRWVGEFMPPESRDLLREAFPRFIEAGGVSDAEFTMLRKDGERIVVLVNGKIARDDRGRFRQTHCILQDVTGRKRAEAEIERLAYFDTLTGLPNRTLLRDRLQQALAQAGRDDQTVAVLFLDLDRFKGVNDTLGHSLGDELLKKVAGRIRKSLRASDTVARLGGDEFVVLCQGIRGVQDVSALAAKIQKTLSRPVSLGEQEIFTSVSIGIALFPEDGRDAETLLKHADLAMYAAKDLGRNAFQFYAEELNLRARERMELEVSLRRGLREEEFFLCYQPQIDLQDGRITGVEALLRWRHPLRGLIPPTQFIPVAEDSGLILPLGEWVLRTACRQCREWQQAGFPQMRVAVNLSGVQFKQSGFVGTVRAALEESGLEPCWLELELTESILMESGERTSQVLSELKKMGLRLAIDDFGTGYSSLAYLKNFPIDRIKIAQDFVRDIPGDPNDSAIVEAIIAMARSLDLQVIAEGVETRRQLEFLSARRCMEMQGYYFARPLPEKELRESFSGGMGKSGLCPYQMR